MNATSRSNDRQANNKRAPATVLVVDDSRVARESIGMMLLEEAYDVRIAPDGAAALAYIGATQPDIVLLDIAMPEMDGIELCRRLREHPTLRYLPVLMVSALADSADIVKAFEAGADGFIAKPVHRTVLTARVKAALRQKQRYEQLAAFTQSGAKQDPH